MMDAAHCPMDSGKEDHVGPAQIQKKSRTS